MPFTLSMPDGVGALQFSVASYESGSPPKMDTAALESMIREFTEENSLGPLRDLVQEQEELSLAAASFSLDEQTFGRVWYVSDGFNVAKVTYVCEQVQPPLELLAAEQIVRSLRFTASDA